MEGENTLIEDVPILEMEEEDQYDGSDLDDSEHEDRYDYTSSDSDSNNETRKKTRKRGLTRLPKLRTEHTNSGGRKKRVKFDEFGRFAGKYRSQLPSYLGDLVRERVGVSVFNWKKVTKEVKEKLWEEITRFYEIEDSRRKYIMNQLGILLRNFRRKLYAKYIKPYLGNTTKLKRIPKRYRTIILSQDHWDKFVEHTV